MPYWIDFRVIYAHCGHDNRPHKSPREGVELVLLGKAYCTACGKKLKLDPSDRERPLVKETRAWLKERGQVK